MTAYDEPEIRGGADTQEWVHHVAATVALGRNRQPDRTPRCPIEDSEGVVVDVSDPQGIADSIDPWPLDDVVARKPLVERLRGHAIEDQQTDVRGDTHLVSEEGDAL